MRRTLSLFASAAAAAGLYAALAAAPATAELGCPDGMTPVPTSAVNQGTKKDQNQNGIVCAKPTTCGELPGSDPCRGGPDEDLFGRSLLGVDGLWYWVTDDV